MEVEEDIKDFLLECHDNLSALDRDLLLLEDNPTDAKLIASAFRAIHNIKGTCGFFDFFLLGELAHATETVLSEVRERRCALTSDLISLIFEALDATRKIIHSIETTGSEGGDRNAVLRLRLEQVLTNASGAVVAGRDDHVSSADFESLHPVASSSATAESPALTETIDEPTFPTEVRQEMSSQLVESTIRVNVGVLDRLMNLVGELVLARNQLLQDDSVQSASHQQASQRLNLITSELQESVMKTRMQPIHVIWAKLPRVVRDLAAQCGKSIRLEMEGADTELDKTILEAIKDPLMHLVRNCCDHGIEAPEQRRALKKPAEGVIHLRASYESGVVNIEISDDGAGISIEHVKAKAIERGLLPASQAGGLSHRDALRLIFMPGFSTASHVTGISGRGVGMDVVRSNIEAIGGTVEILGCVSGTTIRIKIPLTLAIIPGLVVTLWSPDPPTAVSADLSSARSGDMAESSWTIAERRAEALAYAAANPKQPRKVRPEDRFIVPQANLVELVRIEATEANDRIEAIHGAKVLHHRERLIPLVYLCTLLGRPEARRRTDDDINIILLQSEQRTFGLIVDRIFDTQEIVVKPLGCQLRNLICYLGATIMGDGRPALILDIAGITRLAGLTAPAQAVPKAEDTTVIQQILHKLLLFRVAYYPLVAVPLSAVDRLEMVDTNTIEHAAGRMAIRYCGEILPLISLEEMSIGRQPQMSPGTIPVIVFSDGLRRVGLIVAEIKDIVDANISGYRLTPLPGLVGSALVNGRVTDLLDLPALLAVASEGWRGTHAVLDGIDAQAWSLNHHDSEMLAAVA